jgi:hypothetical protein
MAHNGNVRVLVLMHYFGSFPNHMIDEDLLGQALRSRGFGGKILEVEGVADVPEGSQEVAKRSVDQMTSKGWKPMMDTFQAAVGSFNHNIIVYGDS